jgi:predicted MFS family arabinose efflux permease
MALIGVAQLAAFFAISRTERWQFRLPPLVIAQCLGIVGLMLLATGSSSQVFMVSMLTQGILAGVTFTSSLFYSLCAGGPGGRRAGPHEAVLSSGYLLGPILGGLSAEHLGPRAPYVLAAGVILAAIAIETWMLRRTGGIRA